MDPPSLETDGSHESFIANKRWMNAWLEDYDV